MKRLDETRIRYRVIGELQDCKIRKQFVRARILGISQADTASHHLSVRRVKKHHRCDLLATSACLEVRENAKAASILLLTPANLDKEIIKCLQVQKVNFDKLSSCAECAYHSK